MTVSLSTLINNQNGDVKRTGDTMTGALNAAASLPLASAGSVAIGAAASNRLNITGVTPITTFDTITAGAIRTLVFAGALILTHNAVSLILPTAANIATEAGDVAEFESLGSGNWRCTNYHRASGVPVAGLKTINSTPLTGSGNLVISGGLVVTQASSPTQTAVKDCDYATYSTLTTFTGPASANTGDRWAVTVTNGLLTNLVNWNGLKHQGISDATMTLDVVRTWNFKYIDATFGWKVD